MKSSEQRILAHRFYHIFLYSHAHCLLCQRDVSQRVTNIGKAIDTFTRVITRNTTRISYALLTISVV